VLERAHDLADMGTRVFVYTDGDAAKAQALAQRLADELVAMRDALQPPQPGIDEAIDLALAAPGGPVVMADGADNPGGGAAGDATFVLRRLITRGIDGAALGPLWDPQAVRTGGVQVVLISELVKI
jgi:microcystin degradation protein MlrC